MITDVDADGTGRADADATGTVLPELEIDVTPTFVIAAAIATRDFQDVHHDRDRAVDRGGKDIFVNMLTTTGLAQRYVTDWAGPEAIVRQIAIRLGVPCYAGDTLTFSGKVVEAGGGHASIMPEPGETTAAGKPPGDDGGRERLARPSRRPSRAAPPAAAAAAGPDRRSHRWL